MDNSLELAWSVNDTACIFLINTTNFTQNCIVEFKNPYTLKQLKDLQIFIKFFEWFQTVEYLLCFMANILTVTAVIKYEYLHNKPTNILILGLACADGVLGTLSVIKSRLRGYLLFFLYVNSQEQTVRNLLLNHDNRCS